MSLTTLEPAPAAAKSADENRISLRKADVVEAFLLLEALVVSFDRIGSYFAQPVGEPRDERLHHNMLETLDEYLLTPEMVERLATMRGRLGDYLPEDEAVDLAERRAAYWRSPTRND